MCNVQNKTLSMISKNKMYAAMKLPSDIKERISSPKA
jgi:hypothetical protein